MSSADSKRFLAYAISNRRALNGEPLPSFVERAAKASIDYFQVREKDLTDRDLCSLVRQCVARAAGSLMRILVNDRLDIAVAAGAHGVHLGGHSVDTETVRAAAPGDFIIGVSTHNDDEIRAARGADFITFGPVYSTASKAKYGPPVGPDALRRIISEGALPVFPLGGINETNLGEILSLPVRGVAAISLFQNADNLATIVKTIHRGKTNR